MTAGQTPEALASVIRDALKAVAAETTDGRALTAALQLARADDATLLKLRRLIV